MIEEARGLVHTPQCALDPNASIAPAKSLVVKKLKRPFLDGSFVSTKMSKGGALTLTGKNQKKMRSTLVEGRSISAIPQKQTTALPFHSSWLTRFGQWVSGYPHHSFCCLFMVITFFAFCLLPTEK